MSEQFGATAEAERRFPLPFDRRAFLEMASTLGDHDLPIYAHWTGQTIIGKVHLTDDVEKDWAEGTCVGYVNGHFRVDLQQTRVDLYDSLLKSFKLSITCDPIPNHKIRFGARLDVRAPTGTYGASPRAILYEG